jgi:hypothetical protein
MFGAGRGQSVSFEPEKSWAASIFCAFLSFCRRWAIILSS